LLSACLTKHRRYTEQQKHKRPSSLHPSSLHQQSLHPHRASHGNAPKP
jgi:hypothetical protein